MTNIRVQMYRQAESDATVNRVSIMSAGAAEPIVARLPDHLPACEVEASFGPVGVIREAYLAGAKSDLFITSADGMDELTSSGHLVPESIADVGWVSTVLAVRAEQAPPDISTSTKLVEALHAASVLFAPDPVRSTAGRHFAKVLDQVGVPGDKVQTYFNGASAMLALADDTSSGLAVGCTQATEVQQTRGVKAAGVLPEPYGLATCYRCALLGGSAGAVAEDAFELLTGSETVSVRERVGMLAARPPGSVK